jgi:hypothetical protein
MQKIRLTLIILLFAVWISGCSAIAKFGTQPPVSANSGAILFSEDFSSDENGWTTWNQNGSMAGYQIEGFRFFVGEANFDFLSHPGYNFGDVHVDVDAIKVSGPNNNAFGVICRMVDEENFYAFLISSDGYAGILRVLDGRYTLLNNDSMEYAEAIYQGEALNKMSAVCQGNQLSLMVNGSPLLSVVDDSFATGDVGLMAGAYDEPDVDVMFDNLLVSQP